MRARRSRCNNCLSFHTDREGCHLRKNGKEADRIEDGFDLLELSGDDAVDHEPIHFVTYHTTERQYHG
jgi:hypothetical protein